MVRGEKLMVSFLVAHDYVPAGLVVEHLDSIVPFPPDDPEPTVHGYEGACLAVELVKLLLRSFWHFSTPVADVALL